MISGTKDSAAAPYFGAVLYDVANGISYQLMQVRRKYY
jgi:hypothetical protein